MPRASHGLDTRLGRPESLSGPTAARQGRQRPRRRRKSSADFAERQGLTALALSSFEGRGALALPRPEWYSLSETIYVERKSNPPAAEPNDFIREIVRQDIAASTRNAVTRFPPEPNGYLHIGHAKSICLNFGIAREFGGQCNLRMDDTNPAKEEVEYVDSIITDVKWLIEGWADHCFGLKPAGKTPDTQIVDGKKDFFLPAIGRLRDASMVEPFYASRLLLDQIYEWAVELIKQGKAYVCDLTPEETDLYRGAPDKPGKDSPYRNRTVEESLDLFTRMKNGEFPDGKRSVAFEDRHGLAQHLQLPRPATTYRIRHYRCTITQGNK